MTSNNSGDMNATKNDVGLPEIEVMKPRIVFKNKEEAVASIDKWCQETFNLLTKVRRQQPGVRNGKRIKGQRGYKCAYGVERKTRSKDEQRPFQRVKYSGCPIKVQINEQDDGSWMVTSCVNEHEGHDTSENNYLNQNKKLDGEDENFIMGMVDIQANNKNIAEVLSKKTGKAFNSQDVRNIVSRIKENEKDEETIEEILADVRLSGGEVKYKKKDGTNDVNVLFIQTLSMKKKLIRNKPQLFESDTTFGTQVEGYKLWCPIYHDKFTDKWEVSGIVFLATETGDNVEAGMRFFKQSLSYGTSVTKWIFFVDKDFDYINVLELVFNGSLVLLCNVHTARYFREKVFTNKAFWGKAEDTNYLVKDDKDYIMNQILLVRDAPSEELYREREVQLLETTVNLTV